MQSLFNHSLCAFLRGSCLAICAIFCIGAAPHTAQPLTIVSAAPKGDVKDLTQITVRFSDNMRPLGVMDIPAAESPLKLSVADGALPKGTFRWLDPATLAYLFDKPAARPVTIAAHVGKGVRSLAGAALEHGVSWTISTPPLAIVQENARDEGLPRNNARPAIRSTYPLDLASLRAKASLTINGKKLAYTVKQSTMQYSLGRPAYWVYTFDIASALPVNGVVALSLAKGVALKEGGYSKKAETFTWKTYTNLRLASWEVYDYVRQPFKPNGDKATAPPEGALVVRFNNPVRLGDALKHTTVSPPAEKEKLQWSEDSTHHTFSLPYLWQPRTTYTVTLHPGLKDDFGTTLAQEEHFSFTTGDFRPLIYMPGGSHIMETPLGAQFPLTLRNSGKLQARLRYAPWGNEAFDALDKGFEDFGEKFTEIPGAREATALLDISDTPNANIRRMLDIPAALGFSSPEELRGIVLLSLIPDESMQEALQQARQPMWSTAALQVTDIGAVLRLGEKQSVVLAAGLTDGAPIPNAEVRLVDLSGDTAWKGRTGENGIAVLPGYGALPEDKLFCVVSKGGDVSVLAVSQSRLPQKKKDRELAKTARAPWRIHTVSQLPLYQPGQRVNAIVHAREHINRADGKTAAYSDWAAISGETLRVTVSNRRGKVAHAIEAVANAYGSISFSFDLDPNAEPGQYNVTAQSAQRGHKAEDYAAFQVASFRPPDFKVEMTPPESQPFGANTPLNVSVHAEYFSGAKLPGAQVALFIDKNFSWFAPARLAGYKTGPDTFPFWRHEDPAQHEGAMVNGTLDDHGNAVLALPLFLQKLRYPQSVSLRARVQDAATLSSDGTASFMAHPGTYYIGLRAPFIALAGQKAVFELKAATWDNKPVSGKTATLKAERILRNNGEHRVVWEKSVSLANESGDTLEASFAESGEYRVSATIIDEAGREHLSAARVYVPGKGMDWIRFRPGQHLEIVNEDTIHAPGDTARFMLKNPFETATALVAIERDDVLRFEVKEVSGPRPVIEIPINKDDAPYVYASVTLIKGRTASPPALDAPDGAVDEGTPVCVQGAVLLKVSGKERHLSVSVSADAATYRPGATVTASATVADAKGNGKKTQVTFLAVDERVLRAAGEKNNYNPAVSFEALFPHGVYGADMWRNLLNRNWPTPDVASLRNKELMTPRAAAAMADFSTAAGGPTEQSPYLRKDFTPLAFWLAEGETDASGKLTASFVVPDTLTSYRLVAVAADKGSGFGTGASSFRVSKPLQLLSALPKFVTEGDTLLGGVLAQNLSDKAGTVSITAQAEDARLTKTEHSLELAPGQSAPAYFPLEINRLAESSGEVRLHVSGVLNGEKDAAEFVLPVKPARPLTTTAAAGMLEAGESHTLPVHAPSELDPRSAMVVTFAPSPAAGAPIAAKQLFEYPWNCLEQRLSRSWARILHQRHGDLLGLAQEPDAKEKLATDWKAVPGHQNEDGSFRLWANGNGSLFLTAYALIVNNEAKTIGMALPEKTVSDALDYTAKALRDLTRASGKKESTVSSDSAALAVYALSLYKPDEGRSLLPGVLAFCEKNDANPISWGALLLAAQAYPDAPDRKELQQRVTENLEKTVAITPTEMHFASAYESGYWRTMGSRLRDNGMVLASLAASLPEYPRLEALARWVGQTIGDAKTLSTQEAAFGLWGLSEYLASLGGDKPTQIHAVWNGKDTASFAFVKSMETPAAWRISADKLNGGRPSALKLAADKGAPYWTARLQYASATLPMKVENAGFTLTRTVSGNGAWKLGDEVNVTLTVTVPATRRHVLLFDPFPAGFEPLHATRVDIRENAKEWQPPWQWEDAQDDGMLLYAPVVRPGTYTYTYMLRAAAPGVFAHRPAYVEEMYTPEVFGRTNAGKVEVTAGK